MKVLAAIATVVVAGALVLSAYVVGVVAQFISCLLLAEVRQALKLDQPVHIETHGADEMAVFGALLTSPLSWVGVVFIVIPGVVWTVIDVVKKRCPRKQE